MSRAWMPLYIGDFLADTMHLGATERGIYISLLMHCWQHGTIPTDDHKLARISGCDARLWHHYRETMLQFFDVVDASTMQHRRVTIELRRCAEISNKRKDAALQQHSKCRANAEHLHTQSQSQSPSPKEERANALLGDRSAMRPSERFEEFWKAYPKREGANPRKPALAVFVAKLKAGATADEIITGARACAAQDHDKIGTPYIPQAARWLRDERWRDYSASLPTPNGGGDAAHGWTPGKRTSAEILAELEARNGKGVRLETGSSVAEDGERPRENEPELFRDHH